MPHQSHDSVITVSLLDPVRGDAVQSWEFHTASVVRIGRDETNDVVLSDERVSRRHGELARTDGVWTVLPLGRNGIAISGRTISGATPVDHQTVLRLAANGPYLEFRVGTRRNTPAERLADQSRWAAAREREEEQLRGTQTDATVIDLLKRPGQQKPAP